VAPSIGFGGAFYFPRRHSKLFEMPGGQWILTVSAGQNTLFTTTRVVKRESKNNYSRFRFAREPLDAIDKNEETHRPDFPFSEELNKRRYPVRALRYWWLSRAIDEEVRSLDHTAIIIDVGCDRGIIKRFIPPIEGAQWIGLDIDINRPDVELAKYDKRIQADFDEGLPVPDAMADIAICSHVLEHLPRPDFTMG